MNIDKFTAHFAEQFEETSPDKINQDTEFRSLEEWDSLAAMSIIGMVDEIYDVTLTGDDIRSANTVKDIYDIVHSRLN